MSVRQIVKFGPCGKCGTMIPRDDLHGVNTKFYTPSDEESMVRVRLCAGCVTEVKGMLGKMEWSHDSMITKEVEVQT